MTTRQADTQADMQKTYVSRGENRKVGKFASRQASKNGRVPPSRK